MRQFNLKDIEKTEDSGAPEGIIKSKVKSKLKKSNNVNSAQVNLKLNFTKIN